MDYKKLTREEAVRLITPVVDNEASEENRIAFMSYLKGDPALESYYRREKRLKALLHERCPRTPAPPHLRERIEHLLRSPGRLKRSGALNTDEPDFFRSPVSDPPDNLTLESPLQLARRHWVYLAAAAALVLLVLSFYRYRLMQSPAHFNIEEYTYRHFNRHQGQLLAPTIATSSVHTAETELANSHNFVLHVPKLKGADFRGVVLSDFIKGYRTPLLEYQMHNSSESIYIFAFNIDDLNRRHALERDSEAVTQCSTPSTYHVRDINGKHVLSWKWDNVWYTAVSNSDGQTLASMITPLK